MLVNHKLSMYIFMRIHYFLIYVFLCYSFYTYMIRVFQKLFYYTSNSYETMQKIPIILSVCQINFANYQHIVRFLLVFSKIFVQMYLINVISSIERINWVFSAKKPLVLAWKIIIFLTVPRKI